MCKWQMKILLVMPLYYLLVVQYTKKLQILHFLRLKLDSQVKLEAKELLA